MKTKHFLLGFLLLSMFAFGMMTETRGTVYTNGVSVGSTVTLTGTVSGQSGSIVFTCEAVSGTGDWTITWGIVDTGTSVADWTQVLKLDPLQHSAVFDLFLSKDICVALPVADYLTAVAGDLAGYTSSGNTITMGSISSAGIVSTYDTTTGMISNYKAYSGGSLVIDLSSSSAIPGYELPVLLGITAVGTIGIIFIMMKKK